VDLTALATAFSLIFIAELPDKTALTILLLSSRARALPVLLGAFAAFLVQGLIALGLGTLLSRLPAAVVNWGVAAIFLFFGVMLLFGKEEPEQEQQPAPSQRLFAQSFTLVFLAEFGDATQVGSAALVARLHAPWSVFVGSTLALWSVAALMAVAGRVLGPRLPARLLRRVAGALFVAFAVLTALRG
jgi:putative Ca2+/H+ antiporter (TMEM165/GDT1 family)